MAFDANAAIDALDPPVFEYEGRRYKGRHASIFEWYRYASSIEQLRDNQLNVVQVTVLYRKLCNLWFPPPTRRRWSLFRRRPPREPSVADLVLRLPFAVQSDAIKSFMNSQARALGLMMPPTWDPKRPSPKKTTTRARSKSTSPLST